MDSLPPPSRTRQFVHLLAISGLGIAQPILFRLQQNAAYLRLETFQPAAVIFAAIAVLLVPAVAAAAIQKLLEFGVSEKAAWRFQLVAIGAYSLLLFMTLVVWLSRTFQLMVFGIPDSALFLLLALPSAAALAYAYARRLWMRQLLEYAVAGIVLFPAVLFTDHSIRAVLWPQPSAMSSLAQSAQQPHPIVMIVLDGMCGMSLLNENHEIDAVRYPSFAKLAATGTWYRNASTVHFRTDHAVPALLTGRIPPEAARPLESAYPPNLFRILYETHQFEMTVLEPYTRLCPGELQNRLEPRGVAVQTLELLKTTSLVYLRTTIPDDLPDLGISIPHTWFGLATPSNRETQARLRQGLIIYPWDAMRDLQFDHLLNCIFPRSKPGFYFLHVGAPHDPWVHLPSGNVYLDHPSFVEYPQGSRGEHGEAWGSDPLDAQRGWQRYLLQVQWLDTQLGRVLQHLEQIEMLDECMLIVTADHGMAFASQTDRRTPANHTLPDILSVPLFIKYPKQAESVTDDQNVEIIDILPTLLDVIKLKIDEPFDGQSLVSESRYPRPRKTLMGEKSAIIAAPDFPEKFDVVDRMLNAFGSGEKQDRLNNLNTRSELIGSRVEDFNVIPGSRELTTSLRYGGDKVADHKHFVPCYFEGFLWGTDPTDPPTEIAVALNGVIYGTTRTSTDPNWFRAWSVLLPDDVYQPENNTLQIFRIVPTENGINLQSLPLIRRDYLPTPN